MRNSYDNIVVNKPWGKEFLAYRNKDVALWALYIKEGESTSMHCHPTKMTGLVCLKGKIRVDFLADHKDMDAVSKVMIRRGLFHKTTSVSKGGSIVLEIETPNNKADLLRLNDKYGRESKSYEGKFFQTIKPKTALWIKDPPKGRSKTYSFCGKKLVVEHLTNIDSINNKKDDDLIFLLRGGIYKKVDNKKLVSTKSGDVGYAKIMKQVSCQMDGIMPSTVILTIPNA